MFLDDDTVALAKIPALRGEAADPFDTADDLVAQDKRHRKQVGGELPAVSRNVAAADTRCLDPEQTSVIPAFGDRKLFDLDPPGFDQYRCFGTRGPHSRDVRSPRTSSFRGELDLLLCNANR